LIVQLAAADEELSAICTLKLLEARSNIAIDSDTEPAVAVKLPLILILSPLKSISLAFI